MQASTAGEKETREKVSADVQTASREETTSREETVATAVVSLPQPIPTSQNTSQASGILVTTVLYDVFVQY